MSKENAMLAKKSVMQSKAARVITEQPEGTAYDYQTAGRADYAYYEYGFLDVVDMSGKTRVVFAEDGTVYVRNLLFNSGNNFGDNWVKGTIEGNVLSIPLGQSIYRDDENDYDVVLAWGEVVADGEDFALVRDESVTEVKYLIDEDGVPWLLETNTMTENDVFPVEAKSGINIKAASIKNYAKEFDDQTKLCVRLSLRNLSYKWAS